MDVLNKGTCAATDLILKCEPAVLGVSEVKVRERELHFSQEGVAAEAIVVPDAQPQGAQTSV